MFISVHWVYVVLGVLLLVATEIIVYRNRARVASWRIYMVACGALIGLTAGIAAGIIQVWASLPTTNIRPFAMNRWTRAYIPVRQELLYDGAWATDAVLQYLENSRPKYPSDVKTIDICIAAWWFWHRDEERGVKTLQRLGMDFELVASYLVHQQWDKIEQSAHESQIPVASRAAAWAALAKRAEKQGNSTETARCYLQALMMVGTTGFGEAGVRSQAWEWVREHVGKEISVEEYAASLESLATHTQDQGLLEQITFELGKLKLVQTLARKDGG